MATTNAQLKSKSRLGVATAFAFIVVWMMICLPCVSGQNCGEQAGGVVCPGELCCSKHGWCGNTADHCGDGCQSNCGGSTPPPPSPCPPHPSPCPPTPTPPSPTPSGEGVASIITKDIFDHLLLHRNNDICPAKGFYTFSAFIEAAKSFPEFGTTGNLGTRTTELAAFFGQTSHETKGGWPEAQDGPYTWGYCFKEEVGQPSDYCQAFNTQWPCTPGKKYYGRGPMQLSWNYNYGPAGSAIGFDGLGNPDIVANDPIVSFKAALWFWMTPQPPKPSCHDVMTGIWSPSYIDIAARRVAGYGLVTNIINGGLECGFGTDSRQESRIGFYKRYCGFLGISYGSNLDCNSQRPFGFAAQISQPRLITTVV